MKKFLLTILVALSIVLIPNVSAKINVPEKQTMKKLKFIYSGVVHVKTVTI